MFCWCDAQGNRKVFWFQKTKKGNQKLCRPDGTYRICAKRKKEVEELGSQCLEEWQRAVLLRKEYNIWDITAFSCTMNTLLGVKTKKYESGHSVAYIFASCYQAERAVYPFLTREKVEKCQKHVDEFYAEQEIQIGWHNYILHPVCLKAVEGIEEFQPVSISSIGYSEDDMEAYDFLPVVDLNNGEIIRELFIDYN